MIKEREHTNKEVPSESECCDCGHEHCHTHEHHEHEHHHSHDHAHGHSHGCGCGGHEHDEEEERSLPIILIGAGLLVGCIVLSHTTSFPFYVYLILYLIPYLLVGWKTLLESVENLLEGSFFDEDFLMSIASIGAFCVGEYAEGVAVMLLFQLGEWLEDLAVGRTRTSVQSLMEIRPDTARIFAENPGASNGETRMVPTEDVEIGMCIEVHPGERIPLDGEVISGCANLDTAALTGESVPRPIAPGDHAAAGCIATDGVLVIRVTQTAGTSTVQRILDLAENAAEKKTKTEAFITRFSRIYTPAVVIAALVLAIVPSLVTGAWALWIHRALTFLVVSCPCALVISVPLSYFCGIGSASKNGILIKGSSTIEALSKTQIVATDKTGTLTRGMFEVVDIHCANGSTPDNLLFLAANAESRSTHPAARGILAAYAEMEKSGQTPAAETSEMSDRLKLNFQTTEISGRGVKAVYGDTTVLCGNDKLMREHQIELPLSDSMPKSGDCIVYIAKNSVYLGAIYLRDTLKEDTKDAIAAFRHSGVKEIHMLTGDTEAAARPIAEALALDGCHAALLPDGKMEVAETLKDACGDNTLLCLGDGINDAPLLAMADVGCAMGALGSDAAMEAADMIIMNDSLQKAAEAITISRNTMRTVHENIIFALGIKALILILGMCGITGMWAAVFGDVGVCMLCILNAARLNMRSKA